MLRLLPLLAVLACLFAASPRSVVAADVGSVRCFDETGYCISGAIAAFWQRNGGLPVFGFPISPVVRTAVEGRDIDLQWFERARLELHPENPAPFDVLLGRVGVEALAAQGRSAAPVPTSPQNGCRFFAETGQNLCEPFLSAWRAQGLEQDGQPGVSEAENLALFGLPLGPVQREQLADGNSYEVQWFERARFELHPNNPPASQVLFGLLGSTLRPADPGAVVPQLAFGSCSFQPPGDARVDCGTLVLPRNRTQPTASSIALPFAVFRATNPAPDPVIYLSGGPGGAALAAAAGNYRSWRAFAPGRDFIFVDQRGTGVGWPGLYCPELRGAGSRLAGLDAARAEADALLRCRDRFAAQGVAMADFTSAASAADLDTLRAALGYQRWNLFGISYGTRLALTMLRDNPSSIRSVVLDSPYPPQENLYTAMPPTLDQSLRTLFTDCAANAGCNAAYPDLETVFYSLIERLNAQPQSATLYGSRTTLSGDRLLDVMFRLFYRTTIIPRLPQAIYAASNGDFGPFAELTAARGGGAGQAQALYYAIQCAEELSFVSPQEMQSAVNAFPRLAGFYAGLLETSAIGLDFCARFTSATPDPRENQPVVSDTPVLIFAGAYDPITPPQWRDSAAATLSRSYGYTFPATGHAVIGRGACPISIVRSFFAAPEQAPDAGCVGQVGPPAFVLP